MSKQTHHITIGSRGSDLALWQANHVKAKLEKLGYTVSITIIKTKGDQIQHMSLDKIEGKGFFTKELEEALLNKEIDVAVHSHKDLPTEFPKELTIAAVSEREDPSDLLIMRKEIFDEKQRFQLKENAIVGTSSARRKSQLLAFRPDVKLKDIRGNVPTRINKLREKDFDAILLASAGVERLKLDLEDLHVVKLSPKEFIPAPAQGVLALQCREDDQITIDILAKLNNKYVQEVLQIERTLLNKFDGGCHLPLGVYTERHENDEEEIIYKTWLSIATEWNKPVKQFYLESTSIERSISKLFANSKAVSTSSVYITQNKKPSDLFIRWLTNLNYSVDAQSLIEFKLIPFKRFPDCQWIFFSSKHAVKYFFMQKPIIGDVKFGVIGKSTADELRKHGHRAEFMGQSTNTIQTAKNFANKIGTSIVVFPIAKGSMRTIQQQIPKKDNVKDLFVYETIEFNEVKIPDADIIVFTSPSNVDAYFKLKQWLPHQKAVCMGDATASALLRHGKVKIVKCDQFDDLGLFRAVMASVES